jgi:tetratricopeptide (TPR) repeat protein
VVLLTADDVAFALVRARYAGGADRVLPSLLQAAEGVAGVEGVTRAQVLSAAAEVLDDAGRRAEAAEMFRRGAAAADNYGDYVDLRFGLADCLVAAGAFDQADEILNDVVASRISGDFAFPGRIVAAAAAFAEAGEAGRALEWLDVAMDLAGPDVPGHVLEQRRRVRAVLGLDEDEADREAARRSEALDQQRPSVRLREAGRPLVVWWPQPEYDRLTRQLPDLAARLGQSWDEHRCRIEFELRGSQNPGFRPVLCRATADMLAVWLLSATRLLGADGTDDDLASFVADIGAYSEPPEPSQRCWCESGKRYKSCCSRR